jgi:hypothetical protein
MIAIMVVAFAPRTLAVVSTSIHHGQWSGASFKISGEEGCFYSNSLMIQIAG